MDLDIPQLLFTFSRFWTLDSLETIVLPGFLANEHQFGFVFRIYIVALCRTALR